METRNNELAARIVASLRLATNDREAELLEIANQLLDELRFTLYGAQPAENGWGSAVKELALKPIWEHGVDDKERRLLVAAVFSQVFALVNKRRVDAPCVVATESKSPRTKEVQQPSKPLGIRLRFRVVRRVVILWANMLGVGLFIAPRPNELYQYFQLGRRHVVVFWGSQGNPDYTLVTLNKDGSQSEATIYVKDLKMSPQDYAVAKRLGMIKSL